MGLSDRSRREERESHQQQTLEGTIAAQGGMLYLDSGNDAGNDAGEDTEKGEPLSYFGFMKYLLTEQQSCLYIPNGDILLLEERSYGVH